MQPGPTIKGARPEVSRKCNYYIVALCAGIIPENEFTAYYTDVPTAEPGYICPYYCFNLGRSKIAFIHNRKAVTNVTDKAKISN